MNVGFGFSAGDFIAGLDLVATVIDALRESGDASRQYRELVRELHSLETALLHCQVTITDFWEKTQKYHPSLGKSGSSSTPKDHWRKLNWAVLKKDDIEKFKADLRGQTGSINLLLSVCQARTAAIQDAKRQAEQKSLMV
ncbi:hypothetical protein C8A05DRAFT_38090 [Staphylotrichum tortipilum]|uniref:Fungal N-terminal domain-containing protein n=1 Tax=Staphylotrichum tortipilum TaxID=2831512 RepID=A0AAN6RPL3_9PEZI|nr:hypothetical protein C8A05DRAFT_38090 [Staphylotrichum longicolle]